MGHCNTTAVHVTMQKYLWWELDSPTNIGNNTVHDGRRHSERWGRFFLKCSSEVATPLHHKGKHHVDSAGKVRWGDGQKQWNRQRRTDRVTPRGSRGQGRDEVRLGQNDSISAKTATSSAHAQTHAPAQFWYIHNYNSCTKVSYLYFNVRRNAPKCAFMCQ